MENEKIKTLFVLFAHEEYSEIMDEFLNLAKKETLDILRPEADSTDSRLNFLCASIANYRYQQALSVCDRSEYTYAGKMINPSAETVINFAENLVRDYYQLCRDLIKPQNFVFMGIGRELTENE